MLNFCRCAACRHIWDLDIKIFVHRGEAVHFRFRGTNDVFGSEPIVLHRMMKNQVSSRRYVMITSAAAARIALPIDGQVTTTMLDVEGLDKISASVWEIPYFLSSKDEAKTIVSTPGYWGDLLGKLSNNVSSIWTKRAEIQELRGDEQ